MLAKALNINPDRIAVTELFGAIPSSAKTSEYVRMLKAIEENAHIRALVVDIDCPGGGAGASEYLYRAVAKVKANKPVVAFIRGTGASGGYMAGCAATKMIAAPMAIVGSIGVISMRPMLYELLSKIGVRMEVTKSGRLKDMFSNFREPTEEEQVKEQALLDSFYDRFVEIVSEARSMPPERVRELATGEIYTAVQAKENGLIDDLGDLDAAIDLAQALAGLTKRKVTYARPRRGLRDRLLANTAASFAGSVARAVEGHLLERRVEYR